MKILVIEDNPADMRLAAAVFVSADHNVVERISAEQALDHLPTDCPDVILLDLLLPEMTGLAFAERLRRDPATRNIPIVAITAHPDAVSRQRALAAGCDAYVVKPIDTRRLAGSMAEIAQRKRAAPSQP